MVHPKKGTKACEEATKKWRESMLKKYGSKEAFKEQLIKQGVKGGSRKVAKGFAVNIKLAKLAGHRGGRISRRGKAKND